MGKYESDLNKNSSNFVPLSPVSFVHRAALAHPDSAAILFDGKVLTWAQTDIRCRKLAAALRVAGVTSGSTVAVLARNIPASVELSYAVPMSHGVLNMINTRLDATGVAFILDHGEAEILFVDQALAQLADAALRIAGTRPKVVIIATPGENMEPELRGADYEAFLSAHAPLSVNDTLPTDEWNAIALNYTSGTTGNPKGVVYHHRCAYLNALGNAIEWSLPAHPRYLWTLPLFHCNGWCFPWSIAAKAGLNICLRAPAASEIVDSIIKHQVTHLCGAPIVLNTAISELERRNETLPSTVAVMTAGAAPPATVLARAEAVGFDVTHVYGLTEVYGPTAICAWRQEWNGLSSDARAEKRARQGVNYTVLEELSVRDPKTLQETPADGTTIGEVMFRGNVVMKGYLKNPAATEAAFAGGHFHSGDLAVRHQDGHIELKDRSKDIIISGGENISSIEVEAVLYKHPAIAEAAVVAGPHEKWGETPVAFVETKSSALVSEAELIDFCRNQLAHFKCPTSVVFIDLPKTSTGKIQKFQLRDMLKR